MESRYEMLYYGGLILALVFLVAAIVLFILFKIPKVVGELTGSTARKGVRDLKKDVANDTKRKSYSQKTGAIRAHNAAGTTELNGDTTGNLGKESSRKKKEQKFELKSDRNKAIPSMDTYDFVEDEAEITSVLTTDEPGDVNIKIPDEFNNKKEEASEEVTTVLEQTSDDELETEVLSETSDDEETSVLADVGDDSETAVLSTSGDDSETAVLTTVGDDSETSVLYGQDEDGATDVLRGNVQGSFDETSVLTADVQINNKRTKIIYNVIEVHTNEHL